MTNPSRSAAQILGGVLGELGTVPHVSNEFVCKLCLGPVSGFTYCYSCNSLRSAAPSELQYAVVPMTAAANPSDWYRRLVWYKNGHGESMLVIAALAMTYLTAHEDHLVSVLGGKPSVITVVPSTRGKAYEQQPLPAALRRAVPLRDRVVKTLAHVPNATIGRMEYTPSAFRPEGNSVRRQRVLLIEDTWVSGAKSLSAAGALLSAGASSVMVVPIAREIRPGYWGEEHPYLRAMRAPYDASFWPR